MRAAEILTAMFLIPMAWAGPLRAQEIAVVMSGKPHAPIEIVKTGSKSFLDAKKLCSLYGGSFYWYPVSGRVQLNLKGRSLRLTVGSTQAALGPDALNLQDAVLTQASRAFVPLSFVLSPEFSRWSGHSARFDERSRTLIVEPTGTVGTPRAFSFAEKTRISIPLAPGTAYRSVARGLGGVDVVFDFGSAEVESKTRLYDGIVDSYDLRQESKLTRLTVRFAERGLRWKLVELDSPRRVAVDIYGKGQSEVAMVEQAPVTPQVAGAQSKKKRLVVIDPGHGGKDPGATGRRGTLEKDINLAVAKELAAVLRERGDFDILLTRQDDVFVPLSDRSDIANAREADMFVSLHCNAATDQGENGYEVYSVSETASDPAAEKLAAAENAALEFEGKNPQDESAKMILLAMTKTEMINESAAFAVLAEKAIGRRVEVAARGAKQAAFYVLRGTHAPAILVEMAFVSHSKDEARLISRRHQRMIADGIAAGIADYAKRKGWLG